MVRTPFPFQVELGDDLPFRGDFENNVHHVVGNGMRLDDTSEIRLDDRWRDVLGAEDVATFAKIAGSLNASYGYDD